MLESSAFPVEEAVKFFTEHDLEVGLIVPTTTGMRKSIMDAHAGLRKFLLDAGIHDFAQQAKGTTNKVVVQATFITAFDTQPVQVSLYRPETKDGDPRTWIYGLGDFAGAANLIAWFVVDQELFLVNLSDPLVWEARYDPASPLGELIGHFQSTEDSIAEELISKIRAIAAQGWIPSGRRGDTGVGYTLETALGIAANSRRDPDYKGIELKAGRAKAGRKTLFSKTPDWEASECSNAMQVIYSYGRVGDTGRRQLYCTVHARPNPDTLFMRVDDNQVHCMSMKSGQPQRVILWPLDKLEQQLEAKHASTFWVEADVCLDAQGTEHFNYRAITHTRSPLSANLGPLISRGKVTMDLTLSVRASGWVRDHGYLFRTAPRDLDLFFPPSTRHELGAPLAPL